MKIIIKIIIPVIIISLAGCSARYDHVSEDKFVGLWELKGRGMFEGIQIAITKEDEKFTGKIHKLNDNKYVQLFAEVGDILVSDITRSSRYQFRLTEKKIGKELFSLYGIGTSTEFKAEFIDGNTIGLGDNPVDSKVVYVRIE